MDMTLNKALENAKEYDNLLFFGVDLNGDMYGYEEKPEYDPVMNEWNSYNQDKPVLYHYLGHFYAPGGKEFLFEV